MPCAFKAERPWPFRDLDSGCQFNVSEDNLIEVDGKAWCEFHASLENKDENRTVKGEWNESKIEDFNRKVHAWIDEAKEQEKACDLTSAIFPGDINFSKKEFPAVCFRGAHFSGGYAIFSGAQFSGGDVDFEGAQFSGGDAFFHRAQFSGVVVNFCEAQFSGSADFSAAGNNESGEGSNANIFRRVTFEGARFEGKNTKENPQETRIIFENRAFQERTSFRNCFFGTVPEFHNCRLHQDTDFRGANFEDTESDRSVEAYRTLKLAMENVRSRQEETMFYALEMKSLRKRKDTPRSVKFVSLLYEIASDYGRSFGLPLLWLMFVNFVFFLF